MWEENSEGFCRYGNVLAECYSESLAERAVRRNCLSNHKFHVL